jgi:hypothetical protein
MRNGTGQGRVGRGATDWLYVDVDGTLLLWPTDPGAPRFEEIEETRKWIENPMDPKINSALVAKINVGLVAAILVWLAERRLHGGEPKVAIWSMGGQDHAALAFRMCFARVQIERNDFVCLAKPDLMVDDGARHLMAKHPVVLPHEFKALDCV